ncbi:DUF536 domain-containing protein [Lactiplantibacillus pentosus]|uniref:DUF536 domain-containing protein n=1 Tax=Lactiplantibacillus pentosus TaxID=1589 RepID=UPI001C201301|nr:DUF536 domain-containing protein [Lactiplantibacillus pentosus]MBU7527575.1 DUF536 domain-containing protein [Lactiplantibacillus pentosus]MDT6968163.1 DUF536 domain-containing protein [Lactiplantibacillus pentosus]
MPKTIRELADELKVSKQTIQYHYQRLAAKNQQKNSQGANLINPTAERIIRGKVAKKQQIGSKEQPKASKENNELVTTLRSEIDDLKFQRDKQLATKDQQINNKDQQIDHLEKLVDQQQQLQLASIAENRQLKDRIQELSGLLESSKSTQKRQATNKNDNLSNGGSYHSVKDKNDKKDKNHGVDTDEKQKKIHKSKTNNGWWHFW